MTIGVLYFNGAMTFSENIFNTVGYLPDSFQSLKSSSTKWRQRLSLLQMVMGIALYVLGSLVHHFNHSSHSQKYLTLTQQAISLGSLYINHSLFNFLRSYVERQKWGAIVTGAYDFYGRKLLPPLASSFDLQGHLFKYIRDQLDRIHFVTLIPLKFCMRASS